jgi:hypothetical protein
MFRTKYIPFCLIAMWAIATSAQVPEQKMSDDLPLATVRDLYRQVVNRAPSGLLEGEYRKAFAPYLSEALLRKFDLSLSCKNDWSLQNGGQVIKAPFAWSEFGPFSGANERISPGSFRIKSIHETIGGSFRVVVSFRYRQGDGSGAWLVTDRVIREQGRYVLDEVFFPKDDVQDTDLTLSSILSEGCNGGHWIGGNAQQSKPK